MIKSRLIFAFALLLINNISIAQTNTLPYLKSCDGFENDDQRKECTEEKLAELIKAEFDKTEVYKESNLDLTIDLKLKISKRGIIRIANYTSNYNIEKNLLEAITNIGYKVVMKPAMENNIKVEKTVEFDIVINNYAPQGHSPNITYNGEAPSTERIPPTYTSNAPEIFKVVDFMPRFPGCEYDDYSESESQECAKNLMLEFIYDNLNPTQNGYDEDIEGMHVTQFVVNEDGSISDIKVIRSLDCDQCEERIIEVLKSMPTWIPGNHKNKNVKVLYTLPIKYRKSR